MKKLSLYEMCCINWLRYITRINKNKKYDNRRIESDIWNDYP